LHPEAANDSEANRVAIRTPDVGKPDAGRSDDGGQTRFFIDAPSPGAGSLIGRVDNEPERAWMQGAPRTGLRTRISRFSGAPIANMLKECIPRTGPLVLPA
jgi:hypothetical protein